MEPVIDIKTRRQKNPKRRKVILWIIGGIIGAVVLFFALWGIWSIIGWFARTIVTPSMAALDNHKWRDIEITWIVAIAAAWIIKIGLNNVAEAITDALKQIKVVIRDDDDGDDDERKIA